VYRFDDHRYLELKGWDCEGELWYTDTQRGIHTEPVSQFYRIFTKNLFILPNVISLLLVGMLVGSSIQRLWKNMAGRTVFSGENELNGMNAPQQEDVLSFTVVNDQGFCRRNTGCICHQSRLMIRVFCLEGGIQYELEDGTKGDIKPGTAGWAWGMVYMTKQGLKDTVQELQTNWQNQPDKAPEVKGYTGWDHMRCDMDAGR
jgi:hypothetical protein